MPDANTTTNIANPELIDTFLSIHCDGIDRDEGKRWFRRTLGNFMKREPGCLVDVIETGQLEKVLGREAVAEQDHWAVKAVRAGTPVQMFWPFEGPRPDWPGDRFDIFAEIENLRDWLNGLADDDRHWRNLDRISVPEAVGLADAWHRTLAIQVSVDAEDDASGIETVLTFEDGYSFVAVKSPEALTREGQLMGHCVGSYDRQVLNGDCAIYSLRGPDNRPHVTLERRDQRTGQIKGRGNAVPVERYRPHVAALMRELELDASHDAIRMGLHCLDNQAFASLEEVFAYLRTAPYAADLPFICSNGVERFLARLVNLPLEVVSGLLGDILETFRPGDTLWRDIPAARSDWLVSAPCPLQVVAPKLPITLYGPLGWTAFIGADMRDAYADVARDLLAHVRRNPGVIHEFEAANPDLKKGGLRGFFESVGSAQEFDEVRAAGRQRKIRDLGVHLSALKQRLRRRQVGPAERADAVKYLNWGYQRTRDYILKDPFVM